MKVVCTKIKNQFIFYSHNKFLVPTPFTPLKNNLGAATVWTRHFFGYKIPPTILGLSRDKTKG